MNIPKRQGMTLFELLVVMIIIGIVYSVALFSFSKPGRSESVVSIADLKKTALSFANNGDIRLICDESCRYCKVVDSTDRQIGSVRLKEDGLIERYGFNRYGELEKRGKSVSLVEGDRITSCFEMDIAKERFSSPLLLKNKEVFYIFTPLKDTPLIGKNEEQIRKSLFDERLYPVTSERYYGGS